MKAQNLFPWRTLEFNEEDMTSGRRRLGGFIQRDLGKEAAFRDVGGRKGQLTSADASNEYPRSRP